MWSPASPADGPRARRVALWLRVLEVLLTAVLVAVTVWSVLAGA